jgi:AcrR family transcriptional regulator
MAPGASDRSRLTRETVLEAAGTLLVAEGPEALSVRRLGELVGASSQAVYTLFGGKPGLAEALYREGFRRMAAALDAVPDDDDQITRLGDLLRAYRRMALDNPAFYLVMFGRAFPGFEPSPEARAAAWATFTTLVTAVEDGVAAGSITATDAEQTAQILWGVAHGLVALELAGQLDGGPAADERFDRAVGAFLEQCRMR